MFNNSASSAGNELNITNQPLFPPSHFRVCAIILGTTNLSRQSRHHITSSQAAFEAGRIPRTHPLTQTHSLPRTLAQTSGRQRDSLKSEREKIVHVQPVRVQSLRSVRVCACVRALFFCPTHSHSFCTLLFPIASHIKKALFHFFFPFTFYSRLPFFAGTFTGDPQHVQPRPQQN